MLKNREKIPSNLKQISVLKKEKKKGQYSRDFMLWKIKRMKGMETVILLKIFIPKSLRKEKEWLEMPLLMNSSIKMLLEGKKEQKDMRVRTFKMHLYQENYWTWTMKNMLLKNLSNNIMGLLKEIMSHHQQKIKLTICCLIKF